MYPCDSDLMKQLRAMADDRVVDPESVSLVSALLVAADRLAVLNKEIENFNRRLRNGAKFH